MMASDSETSTTSLHLQEDDGWEDAEPDREDLAIVSLFDDQTFPDVQSMVQHCKQTYDFDLVAVIRDLDLDFYSRIRLVNYLRQEASKGNISPGALKAEDFADAKYLQPVLEDDALLFSLDELQIEEAVHETNAQTEELTIAQAKARIQELEDTITNNNAIFEKYRSSANVKLRETINQAGDDTTARREQDAKATKEHDADYFTSYSYNDIHETMLKDTVRTDAYRDFIYDNKHLFKDKIVLDVGCGTGILSMFCAKAGASKVLAVDNSDIIDKARLNVQKNGLSDIITCLRGKIEDISLPVERVDIIISEWMGYCLLYEAMLNSVLWARDRYLQLDGLMVPSHCSLHIAPLTDPDYVSENVEFWYDVYGFDMSAMMDKIYDDVLVRTVNPSNLPAASCAFKILELHSVKVEDLLFLTDFAVKLDCDIENLDGWIIWFDTFFMPSRNSALPPDSRAESWNDGTKEGVAFTTGPFGNETHWRSGVMLTDRHKHPPQRAQAGSTISGSVRYSEDERNARSLEIEVTWHIEELDKRGQQLWRLS